MHHINVPDSKKTITVTFRIDEKVVLKLKDESSQRDLSLNTFVNQILKRFVEWDMFEPKVGMIPMAKPVVIELFRKMSPEEITDMALNVGKNAVSDIATFMKARMDLDSFLSWFETRMRNSSVELSHSNEGSNHTYIMKHDLGVNWSLYHKTVLELIFNELLEKKVDISFNNNMMSIKFSE